MDFTDIFSKNAIGALTIVLAIAKDIFFTRSGFSQIQYGYSRFFNSTSFLVSIISSIVCLNYVNTYLNEIEIALIFLAASSITTTVLSFNFSRRPDKKKYITFGLFSYLYMSVFFSTLIVSQAYKFIGNVQKLEINTILSDRLELHRIDLETNKLSDIPIVQKDVFLRKTFILLDKDLVNDERTLVIFKNNNTEICRFFIDKSNSTVLSDENC